VKASRFLVVLLLMAAAFIGGYGYGRWYGPKPGAEAEGQAYTYYCPMHPSSTSDRPGECPICGMKLVKIAGPSM
jgi:hypothetical protein